MNNNIIFLSVKFQSLLSLSMLLHCQFPIFLIGMVGKLNRKCSYFGLIKLFLKKVIWTQYYLSNNMVKFKYIMHVLQYSLFLHHTSSEKNESNFCDIHFSKFLPYIFATDSVVLFPGRHFRFRFVWGLKPTGQSVNILWCEQKETNCLQIEGELNLG